MNYRTDCARLSDVNENIGVFMKTKPSYYFAMLVLLVSFTIIISTSAKCAFPRQPQFGFPMEVMWEPGIEPILPLDIYESDWRCILTYYVPREIWAAEFDPNQWKLPDEREVCELYESVSYAAGKSVRPDELDSPVIIEIMGGIDLGHLGKPEH